MNKNRIYQGNNVIVEKPRIMIHGHYKDSGYGFYCTKLEKQAKRWALTKRWESIVNSYFYTQDDNLKMRSFEHMTEDWLQFVIDCRRGIEHQYDIVEGRRPMTKYGNLLFICHMIERIARKLHQKNQYVVNTIGKDAMYHLISVANVLHAENPLDVEDKWVKSIKD